MENLKEKERKIRQLPGFSRFQLPLSLGDLRHQAIGCHIISLNVTPLMSDALVVTEAGIYNIPLLDLTSVEVIKWMELWLVLDDHQRY